MSRRRRALELVLGWAFPVAIVVVALVAIRGGAA